VGAVAGDPWTVCHRLSEQAPGLGIAARSAAVLCTAALLLIRETSALETSALKVRNPIPKSTLVLAFEGFFCDRKVTTELPNQRDSP
jgi:hypothetical protein